jgi:hypothetical protein
MVLLGTLIFMDKTAAITTHLAADGPTEEPGSQVTRHLL